jgi:hypothetical protein
VKIKFVFFLSLLSVPLAAQVSRVAPSDFKDTVPAFDPAGAITLPVAHMEIDIAFPRGKKELRELTVVFDPKTGYYLWHCTPASLDKPERTRLRLGVMKKQEAVAFVDSTGLVDFELGSGLFAKVYRRRADSLDAAVSASINEIQQGLMSHENIGFHRDYKLIPVFGPVRGFKIPVGYVPISRDFECAPDRAACPDSVSIIASITKQGNNLRLVLRNRFDVEAIVDPNLDLVSARQLTQPDPPKDRPFPFKK